MTTSTNIHDPVMVKHTSSNGHSWLDVRDRHGNYVAIHMDPHIVEAMADAFYEAEEKLRTYTREQLIAEDV